MTIGKRKYYWLFFDADGTLFDYERGEKEAMRRSFEYFGVNYSSAYLDTYKAVNKRFWDDFEKGVYTPDDLRTIRFKFFLEELGLKIDYNRFSAEYLGNLSGSIYLIDNADELINYLADHYKLLLVTNGLKEVQRSRFGSAEIIDSFQGIVISDEIGAAKPDGRFFDIAFNAAGNPAKSQVLIIGDNFSSDIKGGLDYGIDTCWFNPKMEKPPDGQIPTYTINKLEQLYSILNKRK